MSVAEPWEHEAVRWIAVFTLTVAGFGLLAGLGLWVSAAAVLTFGIGVPAMLVADQRFRPADQPTELPRPDADVAQYLNDDDRKWLGGHGWTAPADEVAIEPKRSSWQTDLDRRIRAQLPISSHPRMAAGGVQVAVTPRSTSVREDIRCVQQKLQALERRDPSDDWQSYLGEAFINPSLIAEHKIEDDAFDTVDICAWGTGRVVRRESTGR